MSTPTLDSSPRFPGPSDDEPAAEKRRHPRLELAVRCWLTDERHALYLRVHDISHGGLSVRAPVPFTPAKRVEVGLELPGGQRVRAIGEVVWVRGSQAETNGPRMGARFVDFLEGETELMTLLCSA